MKILYDHLALGANKYGGVQRYFVELMKRMQSSIFDLSLILSINHYLIESNIPFTGRALSKYLNFRGNGRIINAINRLMTIFKLIYGNYNIYHQTHYDNFGFKYVRKGRKIVTTIHDLNFWVVPEFYDSNYSNYLPQKEMILKSDLIIAVSINTKKDLIKVFNVEESKIQVIYHGVEKQQLFNLSNERIVKEPYLLFVGERYKFKNFDNLALAFQLVLKKCPKMKLVCTGRPLNENEQIMLSELNISDNVIHLSANDCELACLYRDAEIFVYPSYYEGFGMPILEAMLYNCPVVLSNTSCFPEIAGEAGVYFDPYCIKDMANKILLLIDDKEYKKTIISNGKKQIEKFSWEKCANEHIKAYQSLLN